MTRMLTLAVLISLGLMASTYVMRSKPWPASTVQGNLYDDGMGHCVYDSVKMPCDDANRKFEAKAKP